MSAELYFGITAIGVTVVVVGMAILDIQSHRRAYAPIKNEEVDHDSSCSTIRR